MDFFQFDEKYAKILLTDYLKQYPPKNEQDTPNAGDILKYKRNRFSQYQAGNDPLCNKKDTEQKNSVIREIEAPAIQPMFDTPKQPKYHDVIIIKQ